MSELDARIHKSSFQNAELVRILAGTNHAPPALDRQQRIIASLELEIAESDKRAAALEERRAKELQDHQNYRDSHLRRFIFKATGQGSKFASQAQREEAEYHEVLHDSHREAERNADLRAQLAAARAVLPGLQLAAARHARAQRDLDALHNALFGGPTPPFPREDELELAVAEAAHAAEAARAEADAALRALRLVRDAQRCMRDAERALDRAAQPAAGVVPASHHRASSWHPAAAAHAEREAQMHRAESQVLAARLAVLQAQRVCPAVRDLPDVRVGQWVDESREQVGFAAVFLDGMEREAVVRVGKAEGARQAREDELDAARAALQEERVSIFEAVANSAV